MSKDIKPSQLKPGKRYCFKQPNPTLALSENKKMYFNVAGGCIGSVNLNEPVVFITVLKEKEQYVVPDYVFLLPDGSIGRINASMLTFHLRMSAVKIFKIDK
jgi:hypothetical protein